MLKKLLPLFFAAIAALPSFAADVPSQALFQTTSATITTQNLVPAGDCTTGGCAQSLMYAKGAAPRSSGNMVNANNSYGAISDEKRA
jgi:hypothetical protein